MPSLNEFLSKGIVAADHRGDKSLLVDTSDGHWWVVATEKLNRAKASSDLSESFARSLVRRRPLRGAITSANPSYIVYKLTDRCNYSCIYCYDRDFARAKVPARRNEVVREILERKSRDEPGSSISILFHGGEPLLEFPEIEALLEYCASIKKLEISFSLQTNASLLDQAKFDVLKRHQVGICFSVDGTTPSTNELRTNSYHENCYEVILGKLSDIRGLQANAVGLLFTIGAHNVDRVGDELQKIQLDGFVSVSFSLMHSVNDRSKPASPEQLLALFNRLLDDVIAGKITTVAVWSLINWLRKLIYADSDAMCFTSPCGAGRSLITILPSGELSPCDSLFSEKYYFESYQEYTRARQNSSSFRELLQRNVTTLVDCSTCDVRSLCNGTCAGNANLANGAVNSVHPAECTLQYSLIKELIWRLANPTTANPLLRYAQHHIARRWELLNA